MNQPKVIHEFSSQITQYFCLDDDDILSTNTDVVRVCVSDQWLKQYTCRPSNPCGIAIVTCRVSPIDRLTSAKQVVVLDGIQDPGNMGTIIRSMVAFGVTVLCVTTTCVDVYHPKCMAASVGLVMHVHVFNESDWRGWYQKNTLPVFLLSPSEPTDWQIPFPSSFILVAGSEGGGVSSATQHDHTIPLGIRMSDTCESLNVSTSMGIALHQLTQS